VSFVIRALFKKADAQTLITNNKEEAAYLNDLEQMIGDKDVLFYQALIVVHIRLKIRIMPMFCFIAEVLNRINSTKKPAIV
jgi:transcription-repair coupling factor (superfamily II helicase)